MPSRYGSEPAADYSTGERLIMPQTFLGLKQPATADLFFLRILTQRECRQARVPVFNMVRVSNKTRQLLRSSLILVGYVGHESPYPMYTNFVRTSCPGRTSSHLLPDQKNQLHPGKYAGIRFRNVLRRLLKR